MHTFALLRVAHGRNEESLTLPFIMHWHLGRGGCFVLFCVFSSSLTTRYFDIPRSLSSQVAELAWNPSISLETKIDT